MLEDRLFASSRDMMTMDAAIDLRIGKGGMEVAPGPAHARLCSE